MNKRKKKLSDKLRNDVLDLFAHNPNGQLNYKQVARLLKVNDPQLRKHIYSLLNSLTEQGLLKEVRAGKFISGKIAGKIRGRLDLSKSGDGYVIVEGMDKDVFVSQRNLGKALNGDKVELELVKTRGKKSEGRIVEVINRKNRLIVGRLDIQDHHSFLVPDDPKIKVDIFISGSQLNRNKNGFKATAQITDWPDSAKNPFGKIVDVLGRPESNEAEMKSILAANSISFTFPENVLEEANEVPMTLATNEIDKRRDFREMLTITIDPADAKDFDDALSIEFLESDLIRIGVHIADVSHYVQESSALDKEAKERGNSVYLVDRVIPMLPEHLSNGVCSLRPNEDKFTFSAVFDLTKKGEIRRQWFGKTVINSDRRFTYEEAQEIIEGGKGELAGEIMMFDGIAKSLRARRMLEGGLEIHGSEVHFRLDNGGQAVGVVKKISRDANKLVEEFMLLANKGVGKFIGDVKNPRVPSLIYRVHDKPDIEKVQQFSMFVSKFGKKFTYKNDREIAKSMNALFEEMKGENEFEMIQQMAIKSMAKAVYDTENIGHYGLGFEYYAHFTSPIRRYADLIVHRVLFKVLNGDHRRMAGLKEIADHISQTERKAVDAERMSKKYFQALYLDGQEGKNFTGRITGLTDWGIYVELNENYCEGMISTKSIKGDRFIFDEKKYVIYGKRSGKEFNLGEVVKVRLKQVSISKRQIDLELVD